MNCDNAWKAFCKTGKISDYLLYVNAYKTEQKANKEEKSFKCSALPEE